MEGNSAEQMERIYMELDLPNFDVAQPHIEKYLNSVKNYKKNKFRDLRPKIHERINEEWRFAFDQWGYSVEEI